MDGHKKRGEKNFHVLFMAKYANDIEVFIGGVLWDLLPTNASLAD